jgi:hypothetical protein
LRPQQKADACEIAVVDELGVKRDEALDRPVARFLIGRDSLAASVGETERNRA